MLLLQGEPASPKPDGPRLIPDVIRACVCVCVVTTEQHTKNTPNVNYDQEENTVHLPFLFLEVFACMLYTRNNDVNFHHTNTTVSRESTTFDFLTTKFPASKEKKKTNKQTGK